MPDTTATRGTRPFRFGVVAPLTTDLPTWRDRVRRIADSGYSTLLMPDVRQWQPAPGPTLAFAAALADLRVGTWVYASPLRPAWSTAWEAHSLSVLTDGRFEMGVGTGRPGIEDELRDLGLPVVPPSERLAKVRETVTALRDLDGPDLHTPVVMAVRGPKAQALAAELADTVTFALVPDESRPEVAQLARDFRAIRDVELALHVSVIGDTVAPFMAAPRAVALAFGLNLSHGYWMPIAALAAMQPSLQQSTLTAAQRLADALIGAAAAALLLLIPASETGLRLLAVEHGLAIVALVILMHGAAIRFWNYALYCGAIAAGVLILVDRPQPGSYSAVGYRVLWTLCGVAIGVLVMLLAGLLARRTARTPPERPAQQA